MSANSSCDKPRNGRSARILSARHVRADCWAGPVRFIDRKVAIAAVDAKVAEAEKLLDRLDNKLRLLGHDAANDERFTHVERRQG
jgi:hypothetical protein